VAAGRARAETVISGGGGGASKKKAALARDDMLTKGTEVINR